MDNIFEIPLENVIRMRRSVRSYSTQPLSELLKEQIRGYADTLANPFPAPVSFYMLQTKDAADPRQIGTYGMIRGAVDYIGATVADTDLALESLGYAFEKLILYVTSSGLGSCWLGGSFNKSGFTAAMKIRENQILPAVSPIGYAADKNMIRDSLIRLAIRADRRKPWKDLFFANDFTTPLWPADAGKYTFPLEMTRLAPSASNKQPWRIVKAGDTCHFFECRTPGYSDKLGHDIQRIDLGIAACHFHLAALDKKLNGKFQKLASPIAHLPENYLYSFSWLPV